MPWYARSYHDEHVATINTHQCERGREITRQISAPRDGELAGGGRQPPKLATPRENKDTMFRSWDTGAGGNAYDRIGGDHLKTRCRTRSSLLAASVPNQTAAGRNAVSKKSEFSVDRAEVHEYTQVWTWGSGFRGQLGHGLLHGRKKSANRPRRVQFPEGHSICAVASGGFHCVALTDSGELFSWGDNAHGQLGYREVGVDCQPIPRYLALRRATGQQIQVKELACGQHHTAALSKDGELWLWGCGKNGQLGNGDRPIRQAAPRPIPRSSFKNREPVRHVACGDKHTCAVDTAGQLYTWGCGAQGQLGHGNLDDVLSPAAVRSGYLNKREPRRPEDGPPPVDPSGQIRTPYRVLSISCGASLTAAIINDGVLLMWGLGHVFQLREDGQ